MNEPLETGESGNGRLVRWLTNPFYYVAGGKALTVGMGVILLTAVLAFLSRARFDGVLDFHVGLQYDVPLWLALADGFVSWLCLAVPLYVGALIFSSSRVRPVDVFGTQALARTPYMLLALIAFWDAPAQYAAGLVPGAASRPVEGGLLSFIVMMIIVVAVVIWAVWLMYKAFAHAGNMKGATAVVIFIVCVLAGEIASKAVLIPLSPDAGP